MGGILGEDKHHSEYSLHWLRSQTVSESRPEEALWSGSMSGRVAQVTATEVKSQHGAIEVIKSLLEYGVAFVTDVNNLYSTITKLTVDK